MGRGGGAGRAVKEGPGPTVKLMSDVTGAHGGQINGTVIAYVPGGDLAGWLDYQAYGPKVLIAYVEVSPKFRRQGIGTRLVEYLEDEWPEKELSWGMTTPSGTELRRAYEEAKK